jgi:hypothetical protein
MAQITIRFTWPVDVAGYHIVQPKPADTGSSRVLLGGGSEGPRIVRKGRASHRIEPLKHLPSLFRDFACLTDAEQCLAFANKYGHLGCNPDHKAEPPEGEVVSDWLMHAARLAAAIEAWERAPATFLTRYGQQLTVAQVSVELVPGRTAGQPVLQLVPKTLRDAIHLQFAQHVNSGRDLHTCEFCGVWFERGQGGGRKSGARFCSDQCRNRFHNQRRSPGARL